MTSFRLPAVAALCAVFLPASHAARAQQARAGAEPKLAVEVVDGDSHAHPLNAPENPTDGGYAEVTPPPRLPGWKRPEGTPPMTAVRLRLAREGDSVRIKVAAVLDDSLNPDVPGPKYGAREQALATYLAHEGETVRVTELKRFGFRPLALKVVPAEPEPDMPPVPAPARAVNRLKSVEVAGFWNDGAQMELGRLTLRNVSAKNITALEVSVTEGYSRMEQAAPGRPLIAPGGTYEVEIRLGNGVIETPHGVEPQPQPDAVVVGTVVFEDGSYEGDVKTAARMTATQRGRVIQYKRVLALVEGALDAQGQGGADPVEKLKSQVAALRIDVEPTVLDELVSKFPELPQDDGRKLLAASALDGLRSGRQSGLYMLGEVEKARAQKSEGFDLRRQLEALRAQLEKRAGKGRD